MTKVRIGLNGFGRIGRAFTRIASNNKRISIEAVNTSKSTPTTLAYLLQYDSVYRRFEKHVKEEKDGISIDGKKITSYNIRSPEEIPWDKHKIDLVLDCTGIFLDRESLSKHIRGTVKKVITSAPSKDKSIPHIVMGANDKKFDFKNADIISNASCTTNCVALMLKVLNEGLKIQYSFLTTVHAYTNNQRLLDASSKKATRGRAAALSLIPTTTGAAIASCKVTDLVDSQIDAMAIRAPNPIVSLCDLTCIVQTKTTPESVNALYKRSSDNTLKGLLKVESAPLVSSDYIGSPYSCIIDTNYTKVLNGTFIKVFGWYDNEWGYSSRLIELVEKLLNYI